MTLILSLLVACSRLDGAPHDAGQPPASSTAGSAGAPEDTPPPDTEPSCAEKLGLLEFESEALGRSGPVVNGAGVFWANEGPTILIHPKLPEGSTYPDYHVLGPVYVRTTLARPDGIVIGTDNIPYVFPGAPRTYLRTQPYDSAPVVIDEDGAGQSVCSTELILTVEYDADFAHESFPARPECNYRWTWRIFLDPTGPCERYRFRPDLPPLPVREGWVDPTSQPPDPPVTPPTRPGDTAR